MKVTNNFKSLMLGVGLISGMSTAMASSQITVQQVISGSNGLSLSIPKDGSNCDPSIVKKNLEILNKSNVLKGTNLTKTIPAHGHCYGACQSDLEDALVKHCEKAEKLADIVELF